MRATVVDRDDELRPDGPDRLTLGAGRGARWRCGATTRPPTPPPPWPTAVCAGVGFDPALAGVAAAEGARWRAEFWRAPSGLRVLNDSYNANPDFVEAALRNLALVEAPRRVAVLGEMAELGGAAAAAHRRMGELAGSLGIEVVAVGGAGLRRHAGGGPGRGASPILAGLPDDAWCWSRPAARWASTGWPSACAGRGGRR